MITSVTGLTQPEDRCTAHQMHLDIHSGCTIFTLIPAFHSFGLTYNLMDPEHHAFPASSKIELISGMEGQT